MKRNPTAQHAVTTLAHLLWRVLHLHGEHNTLHFLLLFVSFHFFCFITLLASFAKVRIHMGGACGIFMNERRRYFAIDTPGWHTGHTSSYLPFIAYADLGLHGFD